jgi:hypothetical protein
MEPTPAAVSKPVESVPATPEAPKVPTLKAAPKQALPKPKPIEILAEPEEPVQTKALITSSKKQLTAEAKVAKSPRYDLGEKLNPAVKKRLLEQWGGQGVKFY